MSRSVKSWVKAAAERTLGITISRMPPLPVNKHADAALAGIRPWSSRDVVFDVGANDGRTILRLVDVLGRPRFFAFEPVSATYQKLVTRTSHLPNVRTFRAALGSRRMQQPISLNLIDAMNSLVPQWTDAPTGVEMVEVLTLDEVMAEQGIEFIHFLKVDTEGYELEVLLGAERALERGRIGIVQLEIGVDQMGRKFLSLEQARRHLAERGYRLHGIHNQCLTPARPPAGWSPEESAGYNARMLAYCDVLFIRADL